MIPEESATNESQSNGRAEEAGKTVREFIRVLKKQLEDKANMKLAGDEPILQWMTRWAAMLCSRFLVGKDGRTAYERRRSRRCRIVVIPFGETVWYREVRKGKQQVDKGESEMKEGIGLGHVGKTNEMLFGTEQGVIRVYDVIRKAEGLRWDAKRIREMQGTPKQPDPTKPGGRIPVRVNFEDDEQANDNQCEQIQIKNAMQIRRLKITQAMLIRYGYTEGCEGCGRKRANLPSRKHSEACRERLVGELNKDEEGRKMLEKEDERITYKIANQLEDNDRAEATAEAKDALGRLEIEDEATIDKQQLRQLITVGPTDKVTDYGRMGSAAGGVRCSDHTMQEVAWDDVSGEFLCPKEVLRARLKELQYVREKKVWSKITRKQARDMGVKVIGTRWIDINKGDSTVPNHRSRFVAKEYNDGKDATLFASTPPLEAFRMLVSDAATIECKKDGQAKRKVMMINDVARAFFEAKATRTICIELPEEDKGFGEEDMVGLLGKSLYGTRDAALNFQKEVREVMAQCGFQNGKYNVSTYYHPERGLKTMVHGDDFATVGDIEDVKWLKDKLHKRFELKTTIIGSNEESEGRILNRIVRCTENGWEYEADQRHAEYIINALNLQESNPLSTPQEADQPWKQNEEAVLLDGGKAYEYRSLAARANYLAVDRMDIQNAVKEMCKNMTQPTVGDWRKLKRLARYLKGKPRTVSQYKYQERPQFVDGFSDSDWAGCKKTARSTSGGVIMWGSHQLKSWSTTQKSITLSSAEAELVAAVKMSSELIGISQMALDWGIEVKGTVHVDSSAAIGVAQRRGCGKLRHVRVGSLWIQEKIEDGELSMEKVSGEWNPADLLTKGLKEEKIKRFMRMASQRYEEGRARTALQLKT